MLINYLFYIVFTMQVIMLSFYYPRKINERIRFVMRTYPPETHPKLYPQAGGQAHKNSQLFVWVSHLILGLGILLAAAMFFILEQAELSTSKLAQVPLMFGLVQAIPYLLIEVLTKRQINLMRELNQRSVRQADLTPRHLFQFIEPYKIYTAVLLFVLCVACMLYFEGFNLSADLVVLLLSMVLCNGLFVVLTLKLLFGKKQDPYQSDADRNRMITANLHAFTFTSIIVSVYFILNRSVDVFGLQHVEIIFNSLYWQFVVWLSTGTILRNNTLGQINFDVYRA